MLAKDLMTKTIVVVPLDMLVTELCQLLREERISGVPIRDENGRFCGVVTVTDLFNVINVGRELKKGKEWFSGFVAGHSDLMVKDIYTPKLISVLPQVPIEFVVDLMLSENIHTVPVMNRSQTQLYGVIGRHDIVHAAFGGSGHARKGTGVG